jgi:predicted ester cyclase
MPRFSIRALIAVASLTLFAMVSAVPMLASAQGATPEADCPPLSPEAIEARVRAFVEAVNAEDTGRLGELLHPDHQHNWSIHQDALDLQGYLDTIGNLFDAYDDYSFTADEIVTADGAAVLRFTASGMQVLELNGYPPSDQPATWTGILVIEFDNCGQIVEIWAEADHLGRLIQHGSIEAPVPATPAP